jgi:hypothetical protein
MIILKGIEQAKEQFGLIELIIGGGQDHLNHEGEIAIGVLNPQAWQVAHLVVSTWASNHLSTWQIALIIQF